MTDEKMVYRQSRNQAACGQPVAFSVFETLPDSEQIQHIIQIDFFSDFQLAFGLCQVPDKQARRIYAHVVEGIRQIDIAHAEGVSSKAVSYSIKRGLRRMKQIMKNF